MNTCPRCGTEVSASDAQCAKCGKQLQGNGMSLVGKTLLDKYRIEEHLGAGGMCNVYRATHLAMGKEVAIKILKPALAADETIARRFEQEARAASRIHHPHAINVMDYGVDEAGTPFIVMEFVNGVTVGELLRREGALSIERSANILRQACGALDVAHSVGVVHRDIKPDNIIIAEYDGSDWVEVVDFGVAKIQEDVNRRASLTGENIIVGTPRYMSPEQCGEKPVDARSDIYSMGIVLYEMLSGEAPFNADSSTRLLMAHASEPPIPLGEKRPDLPADLVTVVMQSLEKDPSLRPQSAGEFARRFEEAAGLGQPARAGAGRGAFSRISVPLGEEEKSSNLDTPVPATTSLDDEATVVRPRADSAAIPRQDTPSFQNADTPRDRQRVSSADAALIDDGALSSAARYTTPAQGTTYVARSAGYEKHSNTGGIIALVAVVLAVAGVAAYLVFGNRTGSTSESVIEAQQAVTDALARVDMLPKDHPLRTYTADLSQWQGELKAYQEIKENNPQITDRAERYRQKAEDISSQARAALASMGHEPANVSPVRGASNSNAPLVKDQDAAKAAEGAADEKSASEAEETKADEKGETEAAQDNANKSRPRRAEPPIIDPVKSDSSDTGANNSNTRRKTKPPIMEKVNNNGSAPNNTPNL